MSIYNYSYEDMDGNVQPLADYEGKVMLIVNTASKCGFTPQYDGLEALYNEYKDRGFVIIGFPCNQFGGQEPEENEGIAQFCRLNFGVTFPLSKKVDVNGDDADEIFKYLKKHTKFNGFGNKDLEEKLKSKFGVNFDDNSIKWNFTKFLVNKEGEAQRFEPPVTPEELRGRIEELL